MGNAVRKMADVIPLHPKRKRRPRHIKGFPVYRSYEFSGQDPEVRNLLNSIHEFDDADVADASGVAKQTLKAWRKRKTKRPKFATMQAVAMGAGLEYRLMKK